jgi:tRNA (cytidine56-2'-O)-methyltransferase
LEVEVLRLTHRYVRDERVTTHLILTARAFGASKVIYTGQRDEKMEEKIRKVTKMWGGVFAIEYEKEWKQTIMRWKARKGEVIHLTFYGLPIQNVIQEIRESVKNTLIIVGISTPLRNKCTQYFPSRIISRKRTLKRFQKC